VREPLLLVESGELLGDLRGVGLHRLDYKTHQIIVMSASALEESDGAKGGEGGEGDERRTLQLETPRLGSKLSKLFRQTGILLPQLHDRTQAATHRESNVSLRSAKGAGYRMRKIG
jgi:hypothetical protein